MGLITVKALKPAAGEQNTLGSEYALTVSDLGFYDGGVLQFFSVQQAASSDLLMQSDFLALNLFGVEQAQVSDQAFSSGGVDYFQGAAPTTVTDLSFQGS